MTDEHRWIDLNTAATGVDGLRVRARHDGERWVVTDIHLRSEHLTAEALRRGISLARIEASLNSPAGDETRDQLRRPDKSNPERFYAQVAAAYRHYATQTRAPARAIADEAQVPVTTVHRWIREARIRNLLPPGHKGRAG